MGLEVNQWQLVAPFQPRPPDPGAYHPDTICDGWSTEDFVMRLASVRGCAHRRDGVARQDAVEVRMHPPTGVVVFAVGDGASSAKLSELGAQTACKLAVIGLLVALDQESEDIDWSDIVDWTAEQMVDRLGDSPEDVEQSFATTLVAGIVRPGADGGGQATMIQIGDSSAWLLHNGLYFPVLDVARSAYGPSLAPLPRIPAEVRPIEVTLPAGAVLLIGTDGFGDGLGEGTGPVGRFFADVITAVPTPLGLANALEAGREETDGDRTLVAIWPAAGADLRRGAGHIA